jgi:hypothetical protein
MAGLLESFRSLSRRTAPNETVEKPQRVPLGSVRFSAQGQQVLAGEPYLSYLELGLPLLACLLLLET